MEIEQLIINKINQFSTKKICVIGNMPDIFYEIMSANITEDDSIYLFSDSKCIKNAKSILTSTSYNMKNIIDFPITNKKYDWYGWQLIKYYNQLKNIKISPQIFTVIFYRGKHLLQYDIGVLPLVLKMISDGGFLVVYDCSWSLSKSPTMNPDVNNETKINYTNDQINIQHMQFLLDTYIDNNFFEYKKLSSSKIRVYCKKQKNLYSIEQDY